MSLADRVAIDEGVLHRLKTWLGTGGEKPHPSSGLTAKRTHSRRGPPAAPGPQPKHPAFQALAAKKRAAVSKAVTQTAEPTSRVTKSSPALGAHADPTHADPHSPHADADGPLSTRHKPGSLAHTVHLFTQAKAIHAQVKKPVHVVQHGAKRYVSTKVHPGAKVLHTYEQMLREAIAYFRALIAEATVASTVGPFMGSINGEPAVDVRDERPGRRKLKNVIPLIRRSGPAGTGE